MRHLFADRLVLATGVIVILMSILFAFLRTTGEAKLKHDTGRPRITRNIPVKLSA
jgi:hypothetical protein